MIPISVLDENFFLIETVELYTSLVWTERFTEAGEFVLIVPASKHLLDVFKLDRYTMIPNSSVTMIIESVLLETSEDEADTLTVTGRSLESILERRIIWNTMIFPYGSSAFPDPSFQNGIKRMLQYNVISPEIPNRAISNFIFQPSSDEKITNLTIEAQYFGENLYDTIQKLCEEERVGFRVYLSDTKQFVFELYFGVDRSYSQVTENYVVFSPKFGNLGNTRFYDSSIDVKTAALVKGAQISDTEAFYTSEAVRKEGSGLSRREMFVESSDTLEDPDGTGRDPIDYIRELRQKGIDELTDTILDTMIDGDIEMANQYMYGVDFFIGDIVQIVNEYDMSGSMRVSEMVISVDDSGFLATPTFTSIREEE